MGDFVKKYIALFLVLLSAFLVSFGSASFAEVPIESKVKAAFVVNFARFINWPAEVFEDSSAPLVICTVGMDGDNQSFAGVESKKIKGHPVVLRGLASLEASGAQSCQLLYIKSVSEKSLQNYLKDSASAPVVSIGETEGFARHGGTIEFIKIKDRLSFKINNSGAKQKRLQINASLLDLAEEVY